MSAIRISPGQLTDSMALRNASALAGCTTIDSDAAGVYIERNWPGLSTGEELLWRVLAWLNGGVDLCDDAALEAGLDASNLAAARAAIGSAAIA